MKVLLGAHDVSEVMDKYYCKSENETILTTTQKESLKDLRKKVKKALYLIYQALNDDGFEKISSVTSTKEV